MRWLRRQAWQFAMQSGPRAASPELFLQGTSSSLTPLTALIVRLRIVTRSVSEEERRFPRQRVGLRRSAASVLRNVPIKTAHDASWLAANGDSPRATLANACRTPMYQENRWLDATYEQDRRASLGLAIPSSTCSTRESLRSQYQPKYRIGTRSELGRGA